MNHYYAHGEAGEPAVRINTANPELPPFAVISFGDDWDFTSADPDWCRRVANTWTTTAELLDSQQTAARRRESTPDADADLEAGQ